MFEASVAKFVKCVGDKTLIPVPEINVADRCQVFQIATKKNKRWFWQKPTYELTPFNLSDLLCDCKDETTRLVDDVIVRDEHLLDYNRVHTFNLNGKFGAKLKASFDFEFDGKESVVIEAKFGLILKKSANIQQLSDVLAKRYLNLEHELYHEIKEHPRRTMCVVTATCRLANGGEISSNFAITADETSDIGQAGQADGVNSQAVKDLKLYSDTGIAFSAYELLINASGELKLVLYPPGRSEPGPDTVDQTAAINMEDSTVIEGFSGLLNLPPDSRLLVAMVVLDICQKPQGVETFLHLLKQSSELLEEDLVRITKTTMETVLHSKFQVTRQEDLKRLLQLLGFTYTDDGLVEYPTEKSDLLCALLLLFEALDELDDEMLLRLKELDKIAAKHLIYLLTQTLSGKVLQTGDKDLVSLTIAGSTGNQWFHGLGFALDKDRDAVVVAPRGEECVMQALCLALYGLFWDRDYDQHTSHWCRIL